MKIIVTRKFIKPGYTIGNMTIDGRWLCNTLEPAVGTTVEAITTGSGKAIAPGVYEVRMAHSPKFGRRLPRLVSVPGRYGILIHAGNSAGDTSGCILVGKNLKKGRLLQSKRSLETLIRLVINASAKGEKVEICIAPPRW